MDHGLFHAFGLHFLLRIMRCLHEYKKIENQFPKLFFPLLCICSNLITDFRMVTRCAMSFFHLLFLVTDQLIEDQSKNKPA